MSETPLPVHLGLLPIILHTASLSDIFRSPYRLSPEFSPLPSTVTHEHLKERGLFSLAPPPPGANPAEYYHLMASHRHSYGDLLLQTGAAAASAHLPDYMSPVDSKWHLTNSFPQNYACSLLIWC